MSSAELTSEPITPVLIGIPVYGRLELLQRAVRAMDRHTPAEIELVVIDDCGQQRLTSSTLAGWLTSGRAWRLISHQTNQGFVASANEFFELAGEQDVILLNSDAEVLPGWFEGLQAAVASQPRTASASAMADHGTVLSVPRLSRPADPSRVLPLLRKALPVAIELPVAVGHCTWFTRAALAEVGLFDRAFDPGYGEEVDWSMRAGNAGFVHQAALHSYVLHAGQASFGRPGRLFSLARRHELLLLRRHPARWRQLRVFARDESNALAQAKLRIDQILGAA